MGIDGINELKPDPADLREKHHEPVYLESAQTPGPEHHFGNLKMDYPELLNATPLVTTQDIDARIIKALTGVGWTVASAQLAIEALRLEGITFTLLPDKPEREELARNEQHTTPD